MEKYLREKTVPLQNLERLERKENLKERVGKLSQLVKQVTAHTANSRLRGSVKDRVDGRVPHTNPQLIAASEWTVYLD